MVNFNFKYLGFDYQADGCWRHALNVRMVLARTRFGKMYYIWNSTQLSLEVKLQLYENAVVSVLAYGCKAWNLAPLLLRSLNGWNSCCTSTITGQSIREEATEPSLELKKMIRARRLRWVKHVLRAEETYLVRKLLVGYVQDKTAEGGQLTVGFLLMDCPANKTADHLIALAQDREERNVWM